MMDAECVAFLQWALPQLRMRWAGFRKVRRTVCKRLARRLGELGIRDLSRYRQRLAEHPAEWEALDGLCTITISRFYRDKAVFDFLGAELLPALVRTVTARGERCVRVWSAGCASGEEPYTLALLWHFAQSPPAHCTLRIVATDRGSEVLARARRACYPRSSLSLLPAAWLTLAFVPSNDAYCLREEFRAGVEFLQQDVRHTAPQGPFELILCRNLVFTYFDEAQQRAILQRLLARLAADGALLIGQHESLPCRVPGLRPWPQGETLRIFRYTTTA